jgi:hypothetical protein
MAELGRSRLTLFRCSFVPETEVSSEGRVADDDGRPLGLNLGAKALEDLSVGFTQGYTSGYKKAWQFFRTKAIEHTHSRRCQFDHFFVQISRSKSFSLFF